MRRFLSLSFIDQLSFECLIGRLRQCGAMGIYRLAKLGVIAKYVESNFLGFLVCFVILIAYICSIPPYLLGGDHAEFVALARSGGIAHPPGYPLYLAYLRSLTWISPNPVLATGLATAFLGAAQCLVLYVVLRSSGVNQYISAIVVSFWGFSSLSIYLNTHAEVFALNNLLVSLLLLVVTFSPRVRPVRVLACVGLLVGLSISNHHTSILLFPVIVSIIYFLIKRAYRGKRSLAVLVFVAFVSIGLLPYLLLFSWSSNYGQNLLSWGLVNDWNSFVHHFLRRDYGTFSLSPLRGSVDIGKQWSFLLDSMYWSWNILLPFAVVSAVVQLKGFRVDSERSWLWVGIWFSLLLSGPVLLIRFNNNFLAVVERFHSLPCLILALPVADGLSIVWSWIGEWRERRTLGREKSDVSWLSDGLVWAFIVLFLGYFNYSISYRRMSGRLSPQIHYAAVNGLNSVPSGSIVLVHGDHQILPFGALQVAFGMRRDVHVISPAMLVYGWYRDRMERRLGGSIRPGSIPSMLSDIAAMSEMKQRHLFVSPIWSTAFPRARTYQYGIFRKYVKKGSVPPSPRDQFVLNKQLFKAYEIPPRHIRGSTWSDQAMALYDAAWLLLAEDLKRQGSPGLANEALLLREVYGSCARLSCE